MSEYTKGPWKIGAKAGPNRHVTGMRQYGYGKTFTSAPGNIIAYVPISRPEEEDNAKLIAAAPEMVRALELSMLCIHAGHRERFSLCDDLVCVEIRAALRKAGVLP